MLMVATRGARMKHKSTVSADMMAVVIIKNRQPVAREVFAEVGQDAQLFLEGAFRRIEASPDGREREMPVVGPELERIILDSAVRDANGAVVAGSVTPAAILRGVIRMNGADEPVRREEPRREADTPHGRQSELLTEYCQDWTALADEGQFSPVVGRDEELRLLERSLVRKTKNNPVLVGDAGVGKTAIVEALAQKIVRGEVTDKLRGRRLLSLNLVTLLAERGVAGVKALVAAAAEAGDVILYIDEFHCLMDDRRALNLANVLKPDLARGRLKLVGATTAEEFSRFIESDKAFERRLQRIEVSELSPEATLTVLNALKPSYESHHGVAIEPEALSAAIDLSQRFLDARKQPDKSLDLLDEASAMVSLRGGRTVGEDDICEVLSARTGIPVGRLTEDDSSVLVSLADRIGEDVLGQEEAIDRVTDAIKRNRVGLSDEGRPIGSFLFVGPTGVGKTALAKSLAKHLTGDKDAFIRIDMSEYQQEFSESRLIGSPPGYGGYEQGGQLTEAVHRKPYSVILFDEIEKAHPKVYQLLLQVLDDGRLTDGKGRTVDFKNTVIILTSNLGTREVNAIRQRIGFGESTPETSPGDATQAAIHRFFTPEFLNRLDAIVSFNRLDRPLLALIARKQLDELRDRLSKKGFVVSFDDSVVEHVISLDANPDYGARPVRRAIEGSVTAVLTDMILAGELQPGREVTLCFRDGTFHVQ